MAGDAETPINIVEVINTYIIDNNIMYIDPKKLRHVLTVMAGAINQGDASAVDAVLPLLFDSFTNQFSIQQASATTDGYITKEDWLAFSTPYASNIESKGFDFPYVDTNTFEIPAGYIVVSVYINIALNKLARHTLTSDSVIILDDLQVGDVISVRGFIAVGNFIPVEGSSFLDLTDTPSSYSGQAGKFPKVNAGENGLEFDDVGGSQSFEDVLQVNRTATTSPLIPNATEPTGAVNLQQLDNKLEIYNNVNSTTTAPLNSHLNVVADCAITSPTPIAGKGYYQVNVVNGIATIDGVAYGAGSFITKSWLVASWKANVFTIKKPIITNATVSGTYNLDASIADTYNLTLTGNTTLALINTSTTYAEPMTVYVTGLFSLSYPAGATINGLYKGNLKNQLVIEKIGSTIYISVNNYV